MMCHSRQNASELSASSSGSSIEPLNNSTFASMPPDKGCTSAIIPTQSLTMQTCYHTFNARLCSPAARALARERKWQTYWLWQRSVKYHLQIPSMSVFSPSASATKSIASLTEKHSTVLKSFELRQNKNLLKERTQICKEPLIPKTKKGSGLSGNVPQSEQVQPDKSGIESWLEDVQITPTESLTGLQPFNPKTFSKNDTFLYCNVGNSDLLKHDFFTSNDKKIVEATFKDQVLRQIGAGFQPYSTFGKGRFLIKDSSNVRDVLETTKCIAVVITWNGPGFPPPDLQKESLIQTGVLAENPAGGSKNLIGPALNVAKYKKSWTNPEHNAGRRWRWVRVELFKHNDELSEGLDGFAESLKNDREYPGDVTVEHGTMFVDITSVSITDLFSKAGVEKLGINVAMWTEVTVALLTKEFNGRPEIAKHANKFFDLKHDETENHFGLKLCVGNERRIGMDADDNFVLYNAPCAKFFYKNGGSVAEFLINRWSGSYMPDPEGLTKILRGKTVRFHTDDGWVTKTIREVHSSTADHAMQDDKHEFWREKTDLKFSHHDLPCIDVGTRYKRELMPASLCKFVGAQTYTGPGTGYEVKVHLHKKDSINRNVRVGQAAYEIRTTKPTKVSRKVKLDDLIKEAFDANMKVGFLEVGVESRHSAEWTILRDKLVRILKKYQLPAIVDPRNLKPLFLQYSEGGDSAKDWALQLRRWKQNNQTEGEKVLAIVLLSDDQHHATIYNVLKGLGDSSLGIQTYFLKATVLKNKAFDDENMSMAAHEVVRRMARRNLPALVFSDAKLDIAIAIHIEPVIINMREIDKDCGLKNKPCRKYLVALSSRHTFSSRDYKTIESRLFEHDELADPGHIKRELKKFLAGSTPNSTEHQVTLIRTGSEFGDVEVEARVLSTGVKEALGQACQVSYISLHEDESSKALARDQNEHLQKSEGVTMLLADMRDASESRIGKLYRRTAATNSTHAFNIHLFGDRLAVEAAAEPSVKRDSPIEPNPADLIRNLKINTAHSGTEVDSGYGGSKTSSSKTTSPTESTHQIQVRGELPITKLEVKRLVALWSDASLGLHDTKLPIPSHLAQAATKRALTHISEISTNQQRYTKM
ncbi:uncharacterized protein MYCFIDRAFT_173699 [Pseudocercospora fijiensis CIRAD86]|uniref:Uncharacterized protein n=1 Tax=Pseudocercospora fijiensis (strain CIRAD86) TaxID=383855 RepID=M3B5Y4_PSEFD|nr:uncharacterized protein MYCFIDRAFT_173699 [Pseudocercospora fijiensis CIRAD86]EME84772.1 hypothetical protein MYCFIDRAFT_173699 [Pseudocercospora fijiensis CIRAD86]